MNNSELFSKIGFKIRYIRENKGIKLIELSDIVNIEYQNLIRIEKGRTNVTIATLYKLSTGLKTKLTELVDIE
jgi:transcriptional regulator with XRE-family HTH domain